MVRICGLLILLSVPQALSLHAAILYSEDFESGNLSPTWSTGDNDNGGPPAYWGVVPQGFGGETTHAGNGMVYCAAVGFGGTTNNPTYQPSQKSFLSRTVVITNVTTATLQFHYKIPSMEAGVERADVYFGADLLWTARAATNTWTEVKLSLVNYLESTNTLRFEFVSDNTVVFEGWYLDDIRITDDYTPSGPPPNNDWNTARRLLLAQGSMVGQNFQATPEPGEPIPSGSSNSIWFRWRALTNGFVSFNTLGSTFDTLLCVYTGTSVSNLSAVGCNDNDDTNATSLISFNATQYSDYWVRVSGAAGAQGKVRINWQQTNGFGVLLLPDITVLADPSKDFMYGWYLDTNTQPGRVLMRLSSATPNTGLGTLHLIGTNSAPEVYQRIYHGDGSFENRLAGTFTFHPTHNHLHFNDWLTFRLREVLQDDGVGPITAFGTKLSFAVIDLEPFNLNLPESSLLSIFKGGFNQGISVGWMDVYHAELPDQWIDVTGVQPGRYWLESMVDPENRVIESNENNNISRILIDLTYDNHPSNDDFTNAIPVNTPIYGHVISDNRNATLEPGEPNHWPDNSGPVAKATVWYSWTCPFNGFAVITTDGSSFDTLLMVYTGSQITNLTSVAKDDDSGDGSNSRVRFLAQAGQTYKICVASYRDKHGRIELNLSPDLNNLFQNATTISGFDNSISGSSRQGDAIDPGLEPGEPVIAGVVGGRSQWFKWTPNRDGLVTFETRGSSIDTLLGVYLGNSVSNLAVVGQDDNSAGAGPSRITFFATNNLTYRISVDGTNGVRGIYQLSWKSPKAPTLVSQPASTNVLEGSLVRMHTLTDGADPLFYQWFLNETPLIDDGNISGTHGNTLVLGKTLQEHAGRFTVVITNAFGAVTSAPAHVIVLDNPRAVYASSTEGYIGTAVDVPIRTLSVGDEREFHFTLSFDPSRLRDPRLSVGSGATGLTFDLDESQLPSGRLGVSARFPGTSTAPPGNLELLVARFDILPAAPIDGTSPIAFKDSPIAKKIILADSLEAVAVYAAGNVTFRRLPVPPGILQQPIGTNVIAGGDVLLQVSASGDAPLSYQWLNASGALASSPVITGSKTANLRLLEINPAQQGNYRVQITNLYGKITSSEASIVVLDNPRRLVLGQTNAPVGSTTTVPVTLSALGNENAVALSVAFDPNYLRQPEITPATTTSNATWAINLTQITNGLLGFSLTLPTNTVLSAGTQTVAFVSWTLSESAPIGAVSPLLLTNTPVARRVSSVSGSRLITAFRDGSVTFESAVSPLPQIVQPPLPITTIEGSPFLLSVIAQGAPPLGYQWLKATTALRNRTGLSGAQTSVLAFAEALSSDAGKYSVIVSNASGSITSAPVTVTITNNPRRMFVSGSETYFGENGRADIWLIAQRNETFASASIALDGSLFTNLSLVAGTSTLGSTFRINTNQLTRGRLGFEIKRPDLNPFEPGTQHLAQIFFTARPNTNGLTSTNTAASLIASPVLRTTLDASSNILYTAYRGATLKLLRRPIPPQIISSPTSTNIIEGGTLAWPVTATGDAPLEYEWRFAGIPIPAEPGVRGVNSSLLELDEIDGARVGSYQVRVRNAAGEALSTPASVSLLPNPRTLQIASTNAYIGKTANIPLLFASQGNENSLQFSLRFNGSLLSNPELVPGPGAVSATSRLDTSLLSSNWIGIEITLPAATQFSPGTQHVATLRWSVSPDATPGSSTLLSLTNVPLQKVVRETNSLVLATAYRPGTLTLNRAPVPPSIDVPPQNITIAEGDEAVFLVATAGDPPFAYRWFFNNQPLSSSTRITGVNDSKLTLFETLPSDQGSYTVAISNIAGQVVSSPGVLTITNNPRQIRIPDLAATVAQPTSVPVILDTIGSIQSASFSTYWNTNHLEFTSATNGSGSLGAQFEINNSQLARGRLGLKITLPEGQDFAAGPVQIATLQFNVRSNLAQGTTSRLTLTNSPTPRQILDLNGDALPTALRNGTLTIRTSAIPPSILAAPASGTVLEGEDFNLTVIAAGNLPLTYRWMKNGTTLSNDLQISGTTAPKLQIREINLANAGSYSVAVLNAAGAVTSAVSIVQVVPNPRVVHWTTDNAFLGDQANLPLTLNAQGNEHAIEFEASFDPNLFSQPNLLTAADSTTAQLQLTTFPDSPGRIRVRITLPPGNAWAAGTRNIAQLQLTVAPNGTPNATSPVVILGPSDSRSVRDLNGLRVPTVYQPGTITLRQSTVPPSIVVQPASTNILEGTDGTLEVTALGDPPLSYQWFKGTSPVTEDSHFSGTQSRRLLIREVDDTRAGVYTVLISNPAGSVQSAPASVGRLNNPRVLSLDAAETLVGNSAVLPLQLNAQGDEHEISVSLAVPPSLLDTPLVQLDPSMPPANLSVDTGDTAIGVVGIRITLPGSTLLSAGLHKLGSITWKVSNLAPTGVPIPVTMTNKPNAREILGLFNTPLPALYRSGSITLRPPPAPPSVVSLTQDTNVLEGASLVLEVKTAGDQPMEYQWRKDGVALPDSLNIAGSTSPTLSLLEVTPGAAGAYSILLKNALGEIESESIQVTVTPNPRVIDVQEVHGFIGESISIPIMIQASGQEHVAQFSVAFDPALLGNLFVTAGSNAPNASLQLDTSRVNSGLLGIRITLAPGTVLDPGSNEWIRLIALSTSPNAVENQTTSIAIGNVPLPRRIEDLSSALLPALFHPGLVTFHRRPLPPSIVRTPSATNLVEGSTLDLSVEARGDTPLSYQWARSLTLLADSERTLGARGSHLSIQDVTTADSGSYTVTITNLQGSITSAPVQINVTTNPRILTALPNTAYLGEITSTPITLQSQGNENEIRFSLRFDPSALAPAGIRPGPQAQDANTEINVSEVSQGRLGVIVKLPSNTSLTRGSAQIAVIDWNVASTGISEGQIVTLSQAPTPVPKAVRTPTASPLPLTIAPAQLQITRRPLPPFILNGPQPTNVLQGGIIALQVSAAGTGPLAYRWSKSNTPLNDDQRISGSQSSSLIISGATPTDAGDYSVTVTNALGTLTSPTARVEVLPNGRLIDISTRDGFIGEPVIVPIMLHAQGDEHQAAFSIRFNQTSLLNPSISLGSNASNATLESDLSQLSGGAIGVRIILPAGQKFAAGIREILHLNLTLAATGVTPGQRLPLTLGSSPVNARVLDVSNTILATVFNDGEIDAVRRPVPPSITQQPSNLTVLEADLATLSVIAAGDAPLGYQWRQGTTNLNDGSILSGAHSNTLTFDGITRSMAGNYHVVVTNAFGSVTSRVASVEVLANQRFVQIKDTTGFIGENLTLPIQLNAQGDEHSVSLSLGYDPVILQNPIIRVGTNAASGALVIQTNNAANGQIGMSVTLPGTSVFNSGLREVFQVQFTATTTGVTDGQSVPVSLRNTPTARLVENTNEVRLASLFNAGTITLRRRPQPPAFIVTPTGTNVLEGGDLRLSTTANGDAPLSYLWRRNGAPLSDGTGISGTRSTLLVLTTVGSENAGDYSVIVSNSFGSITSAPASVTIRSNPRVVQWHSTNAVFGRPVTVPISLAAQGNERSIQGSIAFDPALLLNARALPGPGTETNLLELDSSQIGSGLVGFKITRSATGPWPARTNLIAYLAFDVPDSGIQEGQQTTLNIATFPTPRRVTAADGQSLPAVFLPATLVFQKPALPPSILQEPVGASLLEGSPLQLQVQAAGDFPLNYQWSKGPSPLTDSDSLSGAFTPDLTWKRVSLTDAGDYSVVITNLSGIITSRTARVTVQTNPRVVRIPSVNGVVGGIFNVPVFIQAQGDENKIEFTLQFDPTLLTPVDVKNGVDHPLGLADGFINPADPGKVWVTIQMPTAQRMAQGALNVAILQFRSTTSAAPDSFQPLTMTDSVLNREVRDAAGLFLPAVFQSGRVLFVVPTPPILRIESLNQEQTTLVVTGTAGVEYILESSPDLVQWTSGFTGNAGFDGTLKWIDSTPRTGPNRFYRARSR